METGLSSNQAGEAQGYVNFAGATAASRGYREVRCYPPVSHPPGRHLAPAEQIAQHAERLIEEILARAGEAPPVIAKILDGDDRHAVLRLVVGACSFDQACRAMALVGPLNEGMPSTHLIDGCISGTWQIDKVDIINYPALGRDNRFQS
jgi:hypothetical protein